MGETQEQAVERYNSINLSTLPKISQDAIKKLQASKTNDQTFKVMIGLCLAIADGDEKLAQKVMSEQEKTLDTCFRHIFEWARKKATQNCAMIDHEAVWSEAIHYYTEVNEKKPAQLPTKKFEAPIEIETPVEDGSISLFGDDDFEAPSVDVSSISLFGDDF